MRTIIICCMVLAFAGRELMGQDREVVAYVSMDQEHSESILKIFEEETGIAVRSVFDTEDAKTVGLTNRIIAERSAPRCDVFWNNEVGQAVRLKDLGLLQPWKAPNAADIPERFKDAEGYWTGFAARARVLIYNTDEIRPEELPRRLEDLTDERFRGRCAMSRPLTGTSLTHAAALYAVWGKERTEAFYRALDANDVRWERGNAQVMRTVGAGTRPFGLTDTDDARVSKMRGRPTATIFLDQEEGGLGTLVIPNTVMIIKDCPHPEEARLLVDFLLSPRVEELLAKGRSGQIPLHPGVPCPDDVVPLERIRAMDVDFAELGRMIERHGKDLEALFREEPQGRPLLWALGGLVLAALLLLWRSRRGGAATT